MRSSSRRALVVALLLAAFLALIFALYGLGALDRGPDTTNVQEATQEATEAPIQAEETTKLEPLPKTGGP